MGRKLRFLNHFASQAAQSQRKRCSHNGQKWTNISRCCPRANGDIAHFVCHWRTNLQFLLKLQLKKYQKCDQFRGCQMFHPSLFSVLRRSLFDTKTKKGRCSILQRPTFFTFCAHRPHGHPDEHRDEESFAKNPSRVRRMTSATFLHCAAL